MSGVPPRAIDEVDQQMAMMGLDFDPLDPAGSMCALPQPFGPPPGNGILGFIFTLLRVPFP